MIVNTISEKVQLVQTSYLVCRSIVMSTRTLLKLVQVKGHLIAREVKVRKPCEHYGQMSYLACRLTSMKKLVLNSCSFRDMARRTLTQTPFFALASRVIVLVAIWDTHILTLEKRYSAANCYLG